jgi:hypothetical protein
MFFALVHQVGYLFGGLPCASAQILGSLPGAGNQVFPSLAASLGGIKNPHQCADTQSSHKPRQTVDLVFLCHDENSPFAQLQDGLSVSNFPVRRKLLTDYALR